MDPKSAPPSSIGPYEIVDSLGKGGMGEVYLAKDPSFGRKVAIKRIRPDLQGNKTIQSRFLREAKVASVLTHPSIVPILSIQSAPPEIYYTMPFVEGSTLRQILRETREEEKGGKPVHPIGSSIPTLARMFLQICEAVAYTHAKGILHRDLKPENIIIGKFGEVMILDWGIADFIEQIGKKEEPLRLKKSQINEDLTRPGKIAGTLAYMAPERLLGKPSSIQTDIYALGVILYQMLTLQLPFQRKTLAAFRKQLHSEELIDPIEMAPYRDIPHQLALICNRCLAKNIAERIISVEELIGDIKKYIDGKPEWTLRCGLDPQRKSDWQFQEHILFAKHVAITQSIDVTDWALLMVSKRAFSDHIKIEAEVKLDTGSQGIGFLLSQPEPKQGQTVDEGYCLWLGSEGAPSCRLFRRSVLVLENKNTHLVTKRWHKIRIEKVENRLLLYIDDALKLSFTSHLPLVGSRVGLIHKDDHFTIKQCKIYEGGLDAMVNCLAVPNALLGHRLFDEALQEYRRIGQSFPGRMEGREALFRAGLTLLEKGRHLKDENCYLAALKEFEKLYRTPGAPLEYLGKSLVYEAFGDSEEEAKCLELSLRKFPKHPLMPILFEHIVYRMHESSLKDRLAAYRIILLALRHIPNLLDNSDSKTLIDSLEKNWEKLPFIAASDNHVANLTIQLAFWLGKIPILVEIAHELTDETLLNNALFALIELGATDKLTEFSIPPAIGWAAYGIEKKKLDLKSPLSIIECRSLQYLLRKALHPSRVGTMAPLLQQIKTAQYPKSEAISFDALEIWMLLVQKKWREAEKLFQPYSGEALTQETSPLHFPYGTWLYMAKGPKASRAHFASILESPYPPTTALPSHFLLGRIDGEKGWIEHAFWWEKKELHRWLELFYRAVGKRR
ncbi:MAG: serine/threonine-protein kinase pknD [Chlamydiota bacterium]|jgi:serine/threonine-protein kinase